MSKEIIGKCPLCGGNIFENPKSYGCGNWKEKNCKFTIWKHDLRGHDFTVEEVKALLDGKEVGPFNLTSKAGKQYTALMYYSKDNQRVEIKFPEQKKNAGTEAANEQPSETKITVPTVDADREFMSIPDTEEQEELPFN